MIQTATRVKPNAFSFRRQLQILQRAGASGPEQHFQDYVSCSPTVDRVCFQHPFVHPLSSSGIAPSLEKSMTHWSQSWSVVWVLCPVNVDVECCFHHNAGMGILQFDSESFPDWTGREPSCLELDVQDSKAGSRLS